MDDQAFTFHLITRETAKDSNIKDNSKIPQEVMLIILIKVFKKFAYWYIGMVFEKQVCLIIIIWSRLSCMCMLTKRKKCIKVRSFESDPW